MKLLLQALYTLIHYHKDLAVFLYHCYFFEWFTFSHDIYGGKKTLCLMRGVLL